MHVIANIDDCAILIGEFLDREYFQKISNFNFSNLDLNNSHEDWDKNLFKQNNEITMNNVIKTKSNIIEYEKGELKKMYRSII